MKIQVGKIYVRADGELVVTTGRTGITRFIGVSGKGVRQYYLLDGRIAGGHESVERFRLLRESTPDPLACQYIRLWNAGRIALPATSGKGFDVLRHEQDGARFLATVPTLKDALI